jgi:hypothetical protein
MAAGEIEQGEARKWKRRLKRKKMMKKMMTIHHDTVCALKGGKET